MTFTKKFLVLPAVENDTVIQTGSFQSGTSFIVSTFTLINTFAPDRKRFTKIRTGSILAVRTEALVRGSIPFSSGIIVLTETDIPNTRTFFLLSTSSSSIAFRSVLARS